jgi:Flp pilus assembly protein TadD
MAALKLKEDATTGQMTLYSPIMPRLSALGFGLIWLVFAGFFLIPYLTGEQNDIGFLLFFLFFAGLPSLSSLFAALMDVTIIMDRNSRTISVVKRLLALPYSSQSLAFGDVTQLELQHVRSNKRTVWMLNAVGRGDKRITLNWNGTQEEIANLAEKISSLIGAPVASGKIKLPEAFEQVLEKIAPNARDWIEQAQADEPSETKAPMVDLNAPRGEYTDVPPIAPSMSPTPMEQIPTMSETPTTASAPSTDLNSLSIPSLEQRIANDAMDSDARYALARKYQARGQPDRAMTLYQEALRLDPTNTNAQNDLGVALQQRGKRTEAEAAYRRAIALDPFSVTAHLNLGLLLRATNRATEASQEFYQARQNAQGDAETRMAEAASTGAKIEPQLSKT